MNLLPSGGVVWKPNNDVVFEILFPNRKISKRLTTVDTTDWWGYIRGDYRGGAWTVNSPISPHPESPTASTSFDYDDFRAALGLEFTQPGGWKGSLGRRHSLRGPVAIPQPTPLYLLPEHHGLCGPAWPDGPGLALFSAAAAEKCACPLRGRASREDHRGDAEDAEAGYRDCMNNDLLRVLRASSGVSLRASLGLCRLGPRWLSCRPLCPKGRIRRRRPSTRSCRPRCSSRPATAECRRRSARPSRPRRPEPRSGMFQKAIFDGTWLGCTRQQRHGHVRLGT